MSAKPVVILCAVATLTLPLAAQDHARRVGVGISVPDIGVFLPINVSAHFRLEPYVDFLSARADYPVSSDTAWDSHTLVGLGVFSVAQTRRDYGPGEVLKTPPFWIMYLMFVMVGAGGLMATAQLRPIAEDFKVAGVAVSLLGLRVAQPALLQVCMRVAGFRPGRCSCVSIRKRDWPPRAPAEP